MSKNPSIISPGRIGIAPCGGMYLRPASLEAIQQTNEMAKAVIEEVLAGTSNLPTIDVMAIASKAQRLSRK